MLMYGSQLVAHAETFEELKEKNKALNEQVNEKLEKNKALNEKLVAHAKELEELKEKNEKLEDNIEEKKKLIEEKKKLIEALNEIEEKKKALNEIEKFEAEFFGELRANIMKLHLKFFREMSKSELEVKLEEMMQNITNDLDKLIARVSKASIKRDNEIKLAIAAPTGAAKEEEWIEQL